MATWTSPVRMDRNGSNQGMIYTNSDGVSPGAPALASYNGQLWCAWADAKHNIWYAKASYSETSALGSFDNRQKFPNNDHQRTCAAPPGLAVSQGILHAAFADSVTGQLIHYQFDAKSQTWANPAALGFETDANPSLIDFRGKLYLVCKKWPYRNDPTGNLLAWATWDVAGGWTKVTTFISTLASWGNMGLWSTSAAELAFSYPANNDKRPLLNIRSGDGKNWESSASIDGESTAYGCSAASGHNMAFVAFQQNSNPQTVFVSTFKAGSGWVRGHETVANQNAGATPAITIVGNTLHCVFPANNSARDLLWYSRPVLDMPLDSWTSQIPPDRLLAELSIPGTHDSCAMEPIPWVQAQAMTITQQLDAGIRYFDMRCKLVLKTLLMFHGDFVLTYYNPLSREWVPLEFDMVLQSMYAWLKLHPLETLVVQVKDEANSEDQIDKDFFAYAFDLARNPEGDDTTWSLSELSSGRPTMGDLRGKIQLMRRFPLASTWGDRTYGIDLTGWPADSTEQIVNLFPDSRTTVMLQDYWYLKDKDTIGSAVDSKWNMVNKMLNVSDVAPTDQSRFNWNLNLTSATSPMFPPQEIALGFAGILKTGGINERLRDNILSGKLPRRLGVVMMNFPNGSVNDLISAIVRTNRFT